MKRNGRLPRRLPRWNSQKIAALYKTLPKRDQEFLDAVRLTLQTEITGLGPAGSVELVYRLGRLLAREQRRR